MNRTTHNAQAFITASQRTRTARLHRLRVRLARHKVRQAIDYAFMPTMCLIIIAAILLTGGKP